MSALRGVEPSGDVELRRATYTDTSSNVCTSSEMRGFIGGYMSLPLLAVQSCLFISDGAKRLASQGLVTTAPAPCCRVV